MKAASCLLALAAFGARADCLIHGTVIDASTGEPLPGTSVLARPAEKTNQPNILRVSDAAGGFCFDRLERQTYDLSAVRPGYLNAIYGGRAGTSKGLPVTVDGPSQTPALTIRMIRSASISGTVTDAAGDPLEASFVMLKRKAWDSDQHRWIGDQVTNVPTDDRGVFRFSHLAPGNYYLSAEERPDAGGLDEKGRLVRESGPATYYAGSYSFEHATPLTLDAGQDASVTVALLSRSDSRHVTARLAPGMEAGAGATLHAEANDNGVRRPMSAKFTADGTVSLENLPPDKYTLSTSGVTPPIQTEVELSDHDIEGLLLAPRPSYEVTIKVIGGPPDLSRIAIVVRDTVTGDLQSHSSQLDKDSYQIKGLDPGVYWLESNGKEGYLKELKVDGRAVADLDLRSGPPASVEVTFSAKLAEVEGRVEHPEGKLAATVVWVNEQKSRIEEIGDSTRADGEWKFHTAKLAPGQYRLFAIESFDEDLWGSPELAATLAEKSVAIELREDDRKQVNLPLITLDDWEKALRKIGM